MGRTSEYICVLSRWLCQEHDSEGFLTMSLEDGSEQAAAMQGIKTDSQAPVGVLQGEAAGFAEFTPRPPSPKYDERSCFFTTINTNLVQTTGKVNSTGVV